MSFISVAGIYLETFDEPLQAMDFAKAKIHSLVMLATSEAVSSEDTGQPDDPERMKFLEVEATFLRRFSMPQQEKLVNCESSHCNIMVIKPIVLILLYNDRLCLQLLEKCSSSPRLDIPFCESSLLLFIFYGSRDCNRGTLEQHHSEYLLLKIPHEEECTI